MARKAIYDSTVLQTGDDTNYSVVGDDWDGTPVKVAPSLGLLKQFARARRQQAAQYMNWVLNQFAQVSLGLIDHTAELEDEDLAIRADFAAADATKLEKRAAHTDTLGAVITLAGAGRTIRLVQNGTDSNSSYAITSGQIVRATTLTANRNYTLATTGAALGDIIEVWQEQSTSNGYKIAVLNGGAGAGTLITLGGTRATSQAAFLFDGTNWKLYRGRVHGFVVEEFLASQSWTAPANVLGGLAVGCGGGGGSAQSKSGITTPFRWIAGTSGGGGALLSVVPVVFAPGTAHDIAIGAGGFGSSDPSANGLDGGPTILSVGATVLAKFGGAQGGRATSGGHVESYWQHYILGGLPRATGSTLTLGVPNQGIRFDTASPANWYTESFQLSMQPAQGGWAAGGIHAVGSVLAVAGGGQPNPFGDFAGGQPGVQGAASGDYQGGGAGGGGGAGPFGAGGNGGNGADAGTGLMGDYGDSPLDNSGAGAGGCGSGGCDASSAGPGRNGSMGGSGRMYLAYMT